MSESRTLDGSGNNRENPTWGKSGEALLRNVPPHYEGLNGPSGSNRPNPRTVSNIVCSQEESIPNDKGLSDFMWAWGQFLDHEMDLTPENADEPLPIALPEPNGGEIPFFRSRSAPATGASLQNPRQQVNVLTSFIDAANVYGTSPARAAVLRAFDGTGKLKTGANDLLPKNPGGVPNAPSTSSNFFLAGDIRANEHAVLACLHTLFVREHNRLCQQFMDDRRFESEEGPRSYRSSGEENPDELAYQHARRIVSGIMQAITYGEFLPALLGARALRPYSGYNPNVNPTISNVFSTCAYRLGHSMLSPIVQRLGMEPIKFEDSFFSAVPRLLTTDGIEPYLAGAVTQRMQRIDARAVDSVRMFLFHAEESPLIDLAALNIQRGRDHGIPDYNTCRVAYGLRPKQDFRDVSSDVETQQRLRRAYDGDVALIDPWVGGLAEDHHQDATVGEFFFHVLKDQFERLRDGDRFWYENDLALSEKERDEIGNTRLADVILRNTCIKKLPQNVFMADESKRETKLSKLAQQKPRQKPQKSAKKKLQKKKPKSRSSRSGK